MAQWTPSWAGANGVYFPAFIGPGGAVVPRLRITASVPVDTQTSVNLTLSSNIAGDLYWVLTDSVTTPTTTQIAAGQDHTGAAATKAGTATMPPLVETTTETGLVVADTYYVHGYVESSDIDIDDTPIASITYFQGVIPAVLGFALSSPPEGYELTIAATGSQGDDLGWVAFAGAHSAPTPAQVLAGSVGDYQGSFTTVAGEETVPVTENDETFTVYVATENSVGLVSPVLSDTQLVRDVVAPVITTWSEDGALTTRNEVTFDFEVDEDGDIYYLATLASAAAPTRATIISTGATEAVVADTADAHEFTGLDQATSYRFSAVAVDAAGNESLLSVDTASTAARAVITAFTVDTDETTDDEITVDVTVDSTGTLFRLATLQSASAPDEATIIAAALSQAVTAATPTTAVYTGLDDDTDYRLSAVFEDADGNTSLISTATETTDEAPVGIRGLTGFSATDYGEIANFAENGATKNEWIWGMVVGVVTPVTTERVVARAGNNHWFEVLSGSGPYSPVIRIRDSNPTSLSMSGGLPSGWDYDICFTAYWERGADKAGWLDDAVQNISVGSSSGNLLDGAMRVGARAPSPVGFTGGVIYSIWRADAVAWNQTKQDAWYAALKANPAANLYPSEAADAWTFQGKADLTTSLAPVKGSGSNMTFTGAGLSLVNRTLVFRP